MRTVVGMFQKLWTLITIAVGAGLILSAVLPEATFHFMGINLSDDAINAWRVAIMVTTLWFVFGRNTVTQSVAEVEKSGPVALFVFGIIVALLESSKLMRILSNAGFGVSDTGVMVLGFAAIALSLYVVMKKYKRS